MAGRDITDGSGVYDLTTDIGIVSTDAVWQNTTISYDTAIGGMPFISAISDGNEAIRQTAPFRKEQFDNGQEPGEQSLTGWWLRSQMSFHSGAGINFYDPLTNDENGHYRFADSRGVDVWTKGEVSLLKKVNQVHKTLYQPATNKRTQQYTRSIQWKNINTYDGVLLTDGYDTDKLYPTITVPITYAELTSNVVTLTCNEAPHNLEVGMQIVVSGVGSPFDGEFRITAIPTLNSFSYALTNANITGATVTGSATSEIIHFIDYNSGADYPVYAICDDGTYAYWITNKLVGGNYRLTMLKKPLNGDSITAETQMFQDNSITVTNAVMEYVKDRIVLCVNNKVYEISTNASVLPTALYTSPSSSHVYTSITASGPAIYISGYNGIQSTISKFTLNTAGVMPTLTSSVTAAEMPVGEIVHKIFYYLGYMMIGTDKGIRISAISDADGSITYGPLIVETNTPCYDFAARDSYVWCASSVGTDTGVIRLNLDNQIEDLRPAYANDLYDTTLNLTSGVTSYEAYTLTGSFTLTTDKPYHHTTGCAFVGNTNRLLFTTSAIVIGETIIGKRINSNVGYIYTSKPHGIKIGEEFIIEGVDATFNTPADSTYTRIPSNIIYPGGVDWSDDYVLAFALTASNVAFTSVSSSTALAKQYGTNYIEDASELMLDGYIKTGNIRYGTLEPKNFKRIIGRGDFSYGSLSLITVDIDGKEYDHITYDAYVPSTEVNTNQPSVAREYVSYKFSFTRDATYTNHGPVFKGYQAKATIATPRQRQISFPVYCFDTETDRNGVTTGYKGRAHERILQLEAIEESGDVVLWQDLNTQELRQVQIEGISLKQSTPPDRFSGYGGIITIVVRTV